MTSLDAGDELRVMPNRMSDSGVDAHTSFYKVRISTVKSLIRLGLISNKSPRARQSESDITGIYTLSDTGRAALTPAVAPDN